MKYDYENLGDDQFEHLTVCICQVILGAGVQGFARGVDGGRDARFNGRAQQIPSGVQPWTGKIIIQAKHTNGFNKKFSDSDFFSTTSSTCVVAQEMPNIKKLFDKREMEYYMLFSNRRLTANGDVALREHLSKSTGLTSDRIMLCGVEQIEMWLKRWPDIAKMADIDPMDGPLIVSPDELAEIIESMAENMKSAAVGIDVPEDRTPLKTKNELNGLTEIFSQNMVKKYLKYTKPIKDFLSQPENDDLKNKYLAAVEEFNMNIIAKKKPGVSFDSVFAYLIKLLTERDPILRANKRLTCTMVFYMYWNCDLGANANA